ncbi:hypothetical protein C8R46DRAFT_904981 [Mycena filopes]|nr:hypothetical protein C8R46DRAFT_904981 [Mycena filopes]
MPPRRRDDIHVGEDVPESFYQGHRGFAVSNDGARVTFSSNDVRPLKRARLLSDLPDDYVDWTPVPDEDDDDAAHAAANTVSSYDIELDDGGPEDAAKRKRYLSSPMTLWRPLAQKFLDALLRREGLGRATVAPACSCCKAAYGPGVRLFRCAQCGDFLQCFGCVGSRHTLTPLHCLKEWNGEHWVEAALSGGEGSLGLVYQLGHGGFPCFSPAAVERTMVVMDVTGIHSITFRFCACERSHVIQMGTVGQLIENGWYPATTVDPETCATIEALELFRLLNVVGNMNVHDFVGTLERKMDPLRTSSVPRSGCAHRPNGIATTPPGGLGVDCWPCPHDGKNLVEGWRDTEPRYQFLFMLLLAMDANCRLKNRLRANEHQDPSLGSGLGYFVEEKGYKEHIKNYVAEKDVSSCIAFAALLQKETRLTTGLRCSGVGGCVCARHGVVRPQGLGDLQKGERYANMDYILLSALIGVAVISLTISYDIACQWKINLAGRAETIAKTTKVSTRLVEFEIQFALPVWHAAAHEISCQTENSLSYAHGVGRTDGEGIERTWAILNPLGFSTKEMGYGARHDAIENKVDHLNFEKNVGQGDTLARKLIVAIAERDRQVAGFAEVDGSLSGRLRKKWQAQIDDWRADRTKPNPYCLKGGKTGPSESAVLHELKAAEALEALEGRQPLTDTKATPAAFIKAGLLLEEAQRRIRAELKGRALVTADRASQIQEMRNSFLKKLRTFNTLQAKFMPGVAALKKIAEEARDGDAPAPKAEAIKLWMPSELTAALRRRVCAKGLGDTEAKLRRAQCVDALDVLRSRLHAQTHLITWRNSQAVGQRAATRSATLIARVGERIGRVADKYRDARAAMIELKGQEYGPGFKPLLASDLNTSVQEESDAKARKKLGRLGSSKRSRNEPSSTKKVFSWLWTAGGGPGEDTAQLHDSVRMEWSKAMARRDRWTEEVQLLREEMKRVLRMLRWTQGLWQGRVSFRGEIDHELRRGLASYARRQIYVHRRVAEGFHAGWNRSMASAVRLVVERDGMVYQELLNGAGVDQVAALGLDSVETAVAEVRE